MMKNGVIYPWDYPLEHILVTGQWSPKSQNMSVRFKHDKCGNWRMILLPKDGILVRPLKMLDENAIKGYWNDSKSTTALTYHAVVNNCARVVLECTEVGLEGKSRSARAWAAAEEVHRKKILMICAVWGR